MIRDEHREAPYDGLLRDVFPLVEASAWWAEAERLLKGARPEDALFTQLAENLRIGPLYTASDLAEGIWGASWPGQAPFLRGRRAGHPSTAPWLVAQALPLADAGAFNIALLHDLKRGQTAINFGLDAAGRRGQDPHTAAESLVGAGGTSIIDIADLRCALEGVDLEAQPILLQAGVAALPLTAMFLSLFTERGRSLSALRGCVGYDPLAAMSNGPAPAVPAEIQYDQLAVMTGWAVAAAPALRTLAADDAPWHEAGADGVLSLGLALASGIQTLREMEARGLSPEVCAPHVAFHLSLDTDFFLEIARLRALRVLWSDVLTAGGCPAAQTDTWIHARSGDRMLSRLDPHVNLLRTTTAAMSAIMGGVDSLHAAPWDALEGADSRDGAPGRRLARNIQLILAHECRLGAVTDPAGGAWYPETLTRQVGEGAWAVMQEIERAGGLKAALTSGLVQEKIAASAAVRAERLARAKDVRVGVNRFAADAGPVDRTPRMDAVWVADRRTAALSITYSVAPVDWRLPAMPQVEGLMAAAAAGASLGSMVTGLGGEGPPLAGWPPVVARRDAEPFEDLVRRLASVSVTAPELGQAHCVCLGDAARTAARLDFTRGVLAVGGFAVTSGVFHVEAQAAIAEARAAEAGVIVLVGLDDTYPGLGAAVAGALSGDRPARLLLAAGRRSPATAALSEAGVTRFIHLGMDLVSELGSLIDALGGAV